MIAPSAAARLLVGIVVSLWAHGGASAQAVFTPTQDPVAGARLFQDKGCIQCHAVNGVGGTSGPDLGRVQRPRSFYDSAAAMLNHVPEMAKRIWASGADRPRFTPAEMSDLMAFLYAPTTLGTSGRVEGGRPPIGEPGDPRRGRQLVTDKGCLTCHSVSGPGGKQAGNLKLLKGIDSPWTVLSVMWNHAFLMELESQSQKRAWPRLRSDEMADLVAFLQALMRSP